MAIEPLGTIMTIQSQTAQKTADNKPAQENMDVTKTEQAVTADMTTPVIQKTEGKDGYSTGENQGQSPGQNTGQGKMISTGIGNKDQATTEQIKKAVEKLNKNLPHSEAVFGIHEETNRVTIKIIDKDTKEILKEYPPEKTLDMIAKVWELAGILVDEKR